jgi:hypothetical protein
VEVAAKSLITSSGLPSCRGGERRWLAFRNLLGVLEKELCPHPNGSVSVYIPETFGYGFENIINELGLCHGRFSEFPTFFNEIESTGLFAEDEGSSIDMIFLGTCESE